MQHKFWKAFDDRQYWSACLQDIVLEKIEKMTKVDLQLTKVGKSNTKVDS